MNKHQIITLDDDPNFNKLVTAKMAGTGYELTTTSSVLDFLNTFKSKRFDFCLVDLNLDEGKDAGFTVIKLLRGKLKSLVPIIVVSRTDENEKITHAFDIGANDFLSKPFDRDMLLAKLQYLKEEEFQSKEILKAHPVPRSLRASEIRFSAKIFSIEEEGITLLAPHFLSKGTKLTFKDSPINEILSLDSVELVVHRNSRLSNGDYVISLLLDGPETIQTVRTWIKSMRMA